MVLAALRQQGQATTLGQKSAWSSFVAGAVARMIAAVITNPSEHPHHPHLALTLILTPIQHLILILILNPTFRK